MLRSGLRNLGAGILGLCLLLSVARAQQPRLEFQPGDTPYAEGGEEASEPPRPFPGVAFSSLTPREPPANPGVSTIPTTIPDTKVVSAVASSPALPKADAKQDAGVVQASCSSCGSGRLSGLGGGGSGGGCLSCGGNRGCSVCGSGPRPGCVPGREPFCGFCSPGDHAVHRFFGGLYECLCCPDPCYDPVWIPLADTAFHVASARPITQNRIRWNAGLNVILADRAEFFWARQDGNGKGPRPVGATLVGSDRIRYHEAIHYFEASTGLIGVIVETPYRSMDPDGAPHAAGFGDIKVGTKTLLFDCELMQVSMQFLTYTPAGVPSKGLGTGHVSLEPSLLVGLKLGPNTYYQGQVSEWIPLGGDPDYAGAILHTHHAVNHVLYRHPGANIVLIGTAELQTWSFQDGAFTDPVLGAFQKAGAETYLMGGPGFRVFICDKFDIGFSASFTLSDDHLPAQLYTTELRFRF